MILPIWLQVVLAGAALAAAVATIWTKVIKPVAKLISAADEMLPLLRLLTEVFKDSPSSFQILEEIVSQFRTDSGSSLRDVVNRLESAAIEGKTAADLLKVGVEATRLLSEQDRAALQRQIVLLDRLIIRVDAASATGLRIEQAAGVVADDLAAAHKRADDIQNTASPGAAADAAVLVPKE